ncbi:MAG TPA: hypothetical protein VHS96_15375 [Bacteroidia bacterium]|jgi:hypothetical protein|nr:hypothetical protein [Bacteroidia bacterium]
MNALFGLLTWFIGIFNPSHPTMTQGAVPVLPAVNPDDVRGVHIINANPRTVVALEDTHFRPSR